MSRFKKPLLALAVLLNLCICQGLLTDGAVAGTNERISPLLNTAAHAAAGSNLATSAKASGAFEPLPEDEFFVSAKQSPRISVRNSVIVPLLFTIILVPKVSSYLSKSVLII
jgi:hypothetical protein